MTAICITFNRIYSYWLVEEDERNIPAHSTRCSLNEFTGLYVILVLYRHCCETSKFNGTTKKNHGSIVLVLLNISKHFVSEKKPTHNFCLQQGKEEYRLLNVFSCVEQIAASMMGVERNGSAPAAESGCQPLLLLLPSPQRQKVKLGNTS